MAKDLCKSCINTGCELQSGIVRTKCDFYMPPNKEQEPCADAISRKAAIVQLYHNKTGDDDVDVIIERDIATIHKLPPVTPKQKWIPVSERLPEIKQHVLLSCYGRVIYGRMISKDGNGGHPVFEICDSVGDKKPVVLETTVHSKYTTSRIKAWMPLPEPYKEEGEDKE
jgi:hypothetical protein